MDTKGKPQFLSYLRKEGLKWTPEREKVFQEALSLEGHFEAEELAYRLRKKGNRISKATVYRTLPLLVESGLLKEAIYGEKHHHYEHIHDEKHHDHLICLNCGKIFEFEDDTLRKREREICEKFRFRPKNILIEIFGHCRKCQ